MLNVGKPVCSQDGVALEQFPDTRIQIVLWLPSERFDFLIAYEIISFIRIFANRCRMNIEGWDIFLYFFTQLPFGQVGAAQSNVKWLSLHSVVISYRKKESTSNVSHVDIVS